jgi:hypothetical protein
VGNIPEELAASDEPLMRVFRAYGKVLTVTIRRKKSTANGENKSWALVTFTDAQGLDKALASPTVVEGDAGQEVVLVTKIADVKGELQKETTGALAKIWATQKKDAAVQIQKAIRGYSARRNRLRDAPLSMEVQFSASTRRLSRAKDTNDLSEMEAAIRAASDLLEARPEGSDSPRSQAVNVQRGVLKLELGKLRQHLARNELLRLRSQLKKAPEVKAAARRFWDLMLQESLRTPRVPGTRALQRTISLGNVRKESYMAVHLRVSKALSAQYNQTEAEQNAVHDWTNDISKFSTESGILIWFQQLALRLLQAAGGEGWEVLFQKYDADNSGELGEPVERLCLPHSAVV